MTGLELENVSKSFDDFEAVKDVSIAVNDGDFAVFVGPSGCGKSTLMRLIAGLDPASAGRIFIQGEDVTRRPAGKRSVAMVFQSYALYPHMTVYENIAFPLKMQRATKQAIDAQVMRAAETVRLESRLGDKPSMLSGGQRQRVAIARAIVRKPSVFLMDEPLSNLDAALRTQMRTELTDLHQRLGSTMIYVTHDQLEAMTMADLIVVLNDGRVEQIGRPMDLYHNPANLFVAGFIGSPPMNFADVSARNGDASALVLEGSEVGQISLAAGAGDIEKGAKMTLGFRPEGVLPAPPPEQPSIELSVRPHNIERLGLHTIVHGQLGDRPITCLFGGDPAIATGDEMKVFVPHDQLRMFDAQGEARATAALR